MEMKFLLAGNGPCLNLGCEAILRSTVTMLKDAFPNARFTSVAQPGWGHVDGRRVRDTRLHHHKDSRSLIFANRWARRMRLSQSRIGANAVSKYARDAAVVLMLGGDTYSMDYGTPRYQISILRQAIASGSRVVIWGASVGPFGNDRSVEREIKDLLSQCYVFAREDLTVSYLSGLGLGDRVRRMSDPAFLLPSERPKMANVVTDSPDRRLIGVNLSPLIGKVEGDEEGWALDAVRFLRRLDALVNSPLVLVPHVFKPKNNDFEFLKKVLHAMGKTRNQIGILPVNLSSIEMKWCISRLRVFIGARTHATIASFSSAVPTLSIGYSVKAQGINNDVFGHTNWVVSRRDVANGKADEKLKSMLEREAEVRAFLSSRVEGLKKSALNGVVHLDSILKS